MTVIDEDPETGATIEIDCRQLGSGAYTIPRSVERLQFRTDARFVLAIETGGMFQRLNNHRFWKDSEMHSGRDGWRSHTCRPGDSFADFPTSRDLPVYCFVDCDPYGFANIYRTLKAGSGNAAHLNQFLSVPRARFLGVTPQDIRDYGLEDATHPLTQNRYQACRRRDPQ